MAFAALAGPGCAANRATTDAARRTEEPGGVVAAGERAYALGDAVRAARILSRVGSSDASYAYASALLAKARTEVEALLRVWLQEIDRMIEREHYRDARARTEHILDEFPLEDGSRAEVEKRLRTIEQGLEMARSRLDELDEFVQEQLLRNELEAATRTLRQAQALAREVDPDKSLQFQQVLLAIELRLGADAKSNRGTDKSAAPASKGKRQASKTNRKSRTAPAAESAESAQTEEAPPELAVDESGDRVQELLRQAAQYQERQAYFNAIVTYGKVLSKGFEPANATAKQALQALEPRRQALIQDYLRRASEFFLKQDLAGAVPFYRKVLLLDDGNKQALEGLQMHENLERIRREREKAQ